MLEEHWAIDEEHDGWIKLLRPVEKTLACGDAGDGAMYEWSEIVSTIEERLNLKDQDIRMTRIFSNLILARCLQPGCPISRSMFGLSCATKVLCYGYIRSEKGASRN